MYHHIKSILVSRILPELGSLMILTAVVLLLGACGNDTSSTNDESAHQTDDVWSLGSDKSETGEKPDPEIPQSGKTQVQVIPASDLTPGEVKRNVNMENPLGESPEVIAAGESHFSAFNCAGCHAPKGGGGMGPPLSDDSWIYGDQPAQIYNSIVQGRPNGMPSYADMLPENVVWQLVAYVGTLNERKDSGEQEPDSSSDDRQKPAAGMDKPASVTDKPGGDPDKKNSADEKSS